MRNFLIVSISVPIYGLSNVFLIQVILSASWSRGDRDADILEVVLAGTLDDDILHSDGRTGLGPGFNDVRIELSECMKIHFKADGL